MIATLAGILGGIWVAKKRGGNRLDMAQYAVGFALTGFFVSYFVLIALDRAL